MFDAALRRAKDGVLAAAARALRGVHPTAITAVGLAIGLSAAGAAAFGETAIAFALFFLNRICDGLDGAVARLADQQTQLGGYLDLMADFAIYAAIPIGLWWGFKLPGAEVALIAMLAAFYINGASWMLLSALIADENRTTTLTMPTGLIEGFETIVFYGLMLLIPAAQIWLFWSFAGLVLFTAGQRIVWACRHLRG